VVLSSGERTVETSIHAGGGKAKSGQIVRLMDVPMARTFGAWDTLHDLPDGAALSNAIKQVRKLTTGALAVSFSNGGPEITATGEPYWNKSNTYLSPAKKAK